MSTAETLAHHLQAFAVGVDEIMQDYTDASVLFTPDGSLRGRAAIRAFFEEFLTKSPRALLDAMTLVRQDIEGEVAYIVWKASRSYRSPPTPFGFRAARSSCRPTRATWYRRGRGLRGAGAGISRTGLASGAVRALG